MPTYTNAERDTSPEPLASTGRAVFRLSPVLARSPCCGKCPTWFGTRHQGSVSRTAPTPTVVVAATPTATRIRATRPRAAQSRSPTPAGVDGRHGIRPALQAQLRRRSPELESSNCAANVDHLALGRGWGQRGRRQATPRRRSSPRRRGLERPGRDDVITEHWGLTAGRPRPGQGALAWSELDKGIAPGT